MLWTCIILYTLLVSVVLGGPARQLPHRVTSSGDAIHLSCRGELWQINSTHCSVTLHNNGSQDISFLTWNSLFDPRAAYRSFMIRNFTTGHRLPPGHSMWNSIHSSIVESHHVVRLAANAKMTKEFDLTKLFKVATAGDYSVSLRPKLQALPPSLVTKNHTRYHIRRPASVTVVAESKIMRLAKSQ